MKKNVGVLMPSVLPLRCLAVMLLFSCKVRLTEPPTPGVLRAEAGAELHLMVIMLVWASNRFLTHANHSAASTKT